MDYVKNSTEEGLTSILQEHYKFHELDHNLFYIWLKEIKFRIKQQPLKYQNNKLTYSKHGTHINLFQVTVSTLIDQDCNKYMYGANIFLLVCLLKGKSKTLLNT